MCLEHGEPLRHIEDAYKYCRETRWTNVLNELLDERNIMRSL